MQFCISSGDHGQLFKSSFWPCFEKNANFDSLRRLLIYYLGQWNFKHLRMLNNRFSCNFCISFPDVPLQSDYTIACRNP